MTHHGTKTSAILLIAGCCMGAGMIGLPVVSALAGFLPSSLAMLFCYLFATTIGFLFLEAALWFDHRVNLISLSHFALGKTGKAITWSFFLFLFYCIFVAYIDGLSQLVTGALSYLLHISFPRWIAVFFSVSCVGTFVYFGTKMVSLLNRVFLTISIASFCALVALGLPKIQEGALLRFDWIASISTLPILLICFGYQNLVPILVSYLNRNVQAIRLAILVGNSIPFAIYALWNFVILGLIPNADTTSLIQMVAQNNLAPDLLSQASNAQSVLLFTQVFAFFTILTPFMTNTLAFVDFLRDGLKIPEGEERKLYLYLLVLVPPTTLTLIYPHIFLRALGFAGGFADIILYAILPTCIVWIGRYVKKIQSPYQMWGGKPLLIAIFLISIAILCIKKG